MVQELRFRFLFLVFVSSDELGRIQRAAEEHVVTKHP
jgi:hypothetical protein